MRVINRIICILICLSLAIVLFGCKDKGENNSNSTTVSDTAAKTETTETQVNKTATEITVGYVKNDSLIRINRKAL